MKLNMSSGTLFFVMAINTLSACSPAANAPSSEASEPASTTQAGGWSAADPLSSEVQEAARFAVQTMAVQSQSRILYKDVIQASQQVVAGLNYQLQLQVTQDGVARVAQAKVWRQLDGRHALTEWTWQGQ